MKNKNIELSELLGPEWADIWLNEKYLFLPGWRSGLTPLELRQQFLLTQERFYWKRQAEQLQRELERLQDALDQAEKSVWWYRRQVLLESKLGMMLGRVAV